MSNARILIVEDEQIIALDIQTTLGSCGYMVVGHTDNGVDAILKAAELRPDLVMMDIGLKGEIDGIEAANQIRAQFDLPVIFLTAFANQSTLERAREAEPFGYILKPFEENDLTIAIEMALYKHGMEYKLRESESKFRNVIKHASDGVILNDSLGNIIEWNRAMEKMTGLMREEVIGKTASDVTFRLWPREKKSAELEVENKDVWKQAVQNGYADPDQMTEREIENLQGARRIIQSNGFVIETKQEKYAGVIIRDITENKRAEKELQESESRYRELIELAADGVLLGSHEGIIIGANSYMLNLTGRTLANLIGLHVSALFDPQEIKNKPFRFDLLQKGETVITERNLLRPDGTFTQVEMHTKMMPNGTYQSIYHDISERKQAEEALIVKETAIASSINAIAMSDLSGRLTYVNQAFLKLWGYDHTSEVLGQPVTAFWKSEDQAGQVVEALNSKAGWVGEMSAKDRQGTLLDVQVSAHLVRKKDGQPICMMASFIDITENKRAEEALRRSEEKFRLLVESMDDIVFTLDLEKRHSGVFGSWVEKMGMTPEMFLGKTSREILGDNNAEIHEVMNNRALSGEIVSYEWSGGTKENPLHVYTTLSPIKDSSGKISGLVGVGRNITQRKILEQVEHEQRQLAEALLDTSAALTGTLKLDEVLNHVLNNIEKLVSYDAAMVLLIEGHSVRKILQRSGSFPTTGNQPQLGNTQANLINAPILNEMIKTGLPCLIPDTQTDSRWRAIAGMGWVRSFISAPIQIRGHIAGVINVINSMPGFFTPLHSERIMAFASQAAIAIENAQLFEQTQYLAMTDPLTEMNNRRYFFEAARKEFERIQRFQRTLSIMMVDIDRFKNINDTYGHSVGDLVLREIAVRIKNSIRTIDIAARYGGEEFIVLMPETGLREACQVAERIRKSVADYPFGEETVPVTATLSIGVAEIDEKSKSIDQLIICADHALYVAKASGRNRVEGYLENSR